MKAREQTIERHFLKDSEYVVRLEKDFVPVEEPLQLLVYSPEKREFTEFAVFMRTPGDDFSLILGFLFTESIICNHTDLRKIYHCAEVHPAEKGNTVKAVFSEKLPIDEILKKKRHFLISSSCGICGDLLLKKLAVQKQSDSSFSTTEISSEIFLEICEESRKKQFVFEKTGGLHAASLFSEDGILLDLKEDVGRHNALDKLIGACLQKLPLTGSILLLSGRVSYELVQKAGVSGISCICSLGAPSTLAIETAKKFRVTLIGFLKPDRYNRYTCFEELKIINSPSH